MDLSKDYDKLYSEYEPQQEKSRERIGATREIIRQTKGSKSCVKRTVCIF